MNIFRFYEHDRVTGLQFYIGASEGYSARSAYLHLTGRELTPDARQKGVTYTVGYPVERLTTEVNVNLD
jgi:hypothetical protein